MASTTVAHPSSSSSLGLSFPKLGKLSTVIEQASEEMTEQQLPEHLKNFRQILESIGFLNNDASIFAQLRSMFPVAEESSLTKFDHALANLFKCDDYHHECFFSGGEAAFRHHLEDKHSAQDLYCFYCTKSGHHEDCSEHASYSQSDQLINHIKEQHGNALYQCNLCFYRGFSADHVFIHQAFEHLGNWEQTLKRAILGKKENSSLTPIEEQFLLQTSDGDEEDAEEGDDDGKAASEDDTEVENSDDESDKVSSNVKISKNSAKELCKIIRCGGGGPAQSDDLDSVVREYFTKHAVVLDARNLEKYNNLSQAVLCAYCQPLSVISNENFLSHAVSVHSAFPILAYDLSGQQFQQSPIKYHITDFGDESDNAEAIVSDFRLQLAENALPRSFDEILMQSAFAYYSTLDGKEAKGTKRKLAADEEEEEVEGGAGEHGAEGGSPSKRRRFVTRYLTKSNLKQIGRFVGTAIVAVGFYQLSHYLPESFQPYLN